MRPTTGPRKGRIGPAIINLGVLAILVGAALLIRPLLPMIDVGPTQSFENKPGLQSGIALNDNGDVDFPGSLRSNLPLIQQAGAGWVRVSFRLGSHYKDWTTKDSRGISAIEYYDVLIKEARAKYGLKVLGIVSNESWPGPQSEWIANSAEYDGGNGDNAYLKAFSKRSAAVLVEHFRGQVDEWEIWNEPNCFSSIEAGMPRGATYMYPSNFAQLLRHVYEDTRTSPNVHLVSGGILASDYGPQQVQGAPSHVLRSQNAGQYLSETYRLGRRLASWETIQSQYGSLPIDDVGVHLYVDQGQTTSSAKVKSALEELRDAYVAFEGPRTPKRLIVSEFGWSTSQVSQRVQAQNLQIAFTTFKSLPYVRNAYWYVTQDSATLEDEYGLQTAGTKANQFSGVAKLAFGAYQEAAVYQPAVEIFGLRLASAPPMSYVGGSGVQSAAK